MVLILFIYSIEKVIQVKQFMMRIATHIPAAARCGYLNEMWLYVSWYQSLIKKYLHTT